VEVSTVMICWILWYWRERSADRPAPGSSPVRAARIVSPADYRTAEVEIRAHLST
jgi:hypothetical protein